MAEITQFNHPWMVAVWPGMGHVALNAGYYLLAKLDMRIIAEFQTGELFDIDKVEVKGGIIQPVRRPQSRFFVWKDPNEKHDLIIFLGEAQPPLGKYSFCRQVIAYAEELGVERIFTFAAMATQMHPQQRSRVFGAATDAEGIEELKRLELEVLEDGNVGGLNGVLLGVALEKKLRGACLLGEMPQVFSQLPFPKASLAILEVFSTIAGIDIDLSELEEQGRAIEGQLGELLARLEDAYGQQTPAEEESATVPPSEEEHLSVVERRRIDQLFDEAARDRSKAFELKQELDRLGVFKEYEDRFLDLFKKEAG